MGNLTPDQAEALLDEVEAMLAADTARAMRRFLRELTEAATSPAALTASVDPADLPPPGPGGPTLGQVAGWWSRVVQTDLVPAIRKAWDLVYRRFADGSRVEATSIDSLPEYVQNVSDRLVRGLTPPVYEDSFDRIRSSLVQSAAQGWTKPQLAQRIAAELSWEDQGPYWRDVLGETDRRIDELLDPLGPPGTPARDWAQHHDPKVQALRDDRNRAIREIEAEQSHWKTRADRIARTESTGAQNNAALQALQDEGWASKEWLATLDTRTRPEHAALHGQRRALSDPFTVDGYELQHPGDPDAPARAVVNCRCALVGSDEAPTPVEPQPEQDPEPLEEEDWEENLYGISDADLEAEVNRYMEAGDFEDARFMRLAEELDRRDDPARRLPFDDERDREEWEAQQRVDGGKLWRYRAGSGMTEREQRAQYELWIESALVQWERATNGFIINRAGQAKGVRARDYLTRYRTANKWLTDEAQMWLAANPSMSFAEYRAGRISHLENNEWT